MMGILPMMEEGMEDSYNPEVLDQYLAAQV
jgi:hypothetical protein